MPQISKAIVELSPAAYGALTALGDNLRYAIKSRENLQDFAQRIGVGRNTLRKLLNGDPSVQVGVLVAALDAIGLLDHMEGMASPERDEVGRSLRLSRGKINQSIIDNDF